MKTLIIYDSKHGCTADAASRLADALGEHSLVHRLEHGNVELSVLKSCDTIVLGAPVYLGAWSSKMLRFVRENEDLLRERRFAYFIVGMVWTDGVETVKNSLPESLASKALAATKIGGELHWERLSFYERLITRMVAGPEKNYSNIDWDSLLKFAEEIKSAA